MMALQSFAEPLLIPSAPTPSHTSRTEVSHSTGGSNNSEEHSHPSLEGSSYLTPPLSRGDDDIPPYKARSESSGSLNMIEHNAYMLSKSNPQGGPGKRRKRSKAHEKNSQRQSRLLCSDRDSKGMTNASLDLSESCDSYKSLRATEQLVKDNRQGRLGQNISTPAPPITTRRWSSVGTDSLHYSSRICKGREEPCNRRSTGLGLQEVEFIQAVRSKLTSRRVSIKYVDTPATITLRRATGTTKEKANGNLSPESPPAADPEQQLPAYLITSGDLDSIIGLIQSTFKAGLRKKISSAMSDPSTENIDRKLSVTAGGVLPRPSVPANPTTTVAEVMRTSEIPNKQRVESHRSHLGGGILNIASGGSQRKSIYEVIWKGNSSSQDPSCVPRAPPSGSEMHKIGSESGDINTSNAQASPADPSDQIHHFKEISSLSFFKPVWNAPTGTTSDVAVVGPQSSSHEHQSHKTQIPDVFSFPPLPSRRRTSDWISPLPDIHMSPMLRITETPSLTDNRCLYDSGIDARTGRSHNVVASPTEARNISEATSPDSSGSVTPCQSSAPNTSDKTVPYSQASSRMGSLTLGHVIGLSSEVRRKSSAQSNHVRIEHALPVRPHESGPWIKPRKDSGWPMLKSPTTEEIDTRRNSQNVLLAHGEPVIATRRIDIDVDGNWDIVGDQPVR